MKMTEYPLGIRNNNPGNIRFLSRRPFNGQVGEAGGFGVYDTMQNGIRAAAKQIRSYIRQGYNCPHTIINHWAPPSENDTGAYIKAVVTGTHIEEYALIFEDDEEEISNICFEIFCHENGRKAFTDAVSLPVFDEGIKSAFEGS